MKKSTLLFALSGLIFAACGGGGGGGGTPASGGGGGGSGGGTTNTPPVASASASKTDPREGETITLDGSASSDADGNTLTFSWVQTSGPTLTISAPSSATTEISVPEISANASAVVQLQVSDGTVTRTVDVTLSLQNITLTPEVDLGLSFRRSLDFPGGAVSFASISDFDTRVFAIEADGAVTPVGLNPDQNLVAFNPLSPVSSPERVVVVDQQRLGAIQPFIVDFTATSAIFRENGNAPEAFSVAATAPCAALNTGDFLVIGQENGEIIIFDLPPDNNPDNLSERQRLQITGPACHLAYDDPNVLVAYDDSDQSLKYFEFGIALPSMRSWRALPNQPVLLGLSAGQRVEFVDLISFGPNNDIGRGSGVGLVFTDGVTEGEHRFVFAKFDRVGVVPQQALYGWDFGTPVAMSAQNIDQGNTAAANLAELVILTPDSPYAIVIRSDGQFGLDGTTGLRPIEFVEIGFGAEQITPFSSVGLNLRGFIISRNGDQLEVIASQAQ